MSRSPVRHRFISQIFWPEHCLNLGCRGYLVGWNTHDFKCLVATVIPVSDGAASHFALDGPPASKTSPLTSTQQPLEKEARLGGPSAAAAATSASGLEAIEAALAAIAADGRMSAINAFCSAQASAPIVLGEWVPKAAGTPAAKPASAAAAGCGGVGTAARFAGAPSGDGDTAASRRRTANIWVTLTEEGGFPVLHSLYCCGSPYRTWCYLVLYGHCDPDRLEYLPTIDATDNATKAGDDTGKGSGCGDGGGGGSDGDDGVAVDAGVLRDGGSSGDTSRNGAASEVDGGGAKSGHSGMGRGSSNAAEGSRHANGDGDSTGGEGRGRNSKAGEVNGARNGKGKERRGFFGGERGSSNGGAATDLEYTIRQVSAARTLERLLQEALTWLPPPPPPPPPRPARLQATDPSDRWKASDPYFSSFLARQPRRRQRRQCSEDDEGGTTAGHHQDGAAPPQEEEGRTAAVSHAPQNADSSGSGGNTAAGHDRSGRGGVDAVAGPQGNDGDGGGAGAQVLCVVLMVVRASVAANKAMLERPFLWTPLSARRWQSPAQVSLACMHVHWHLHFLLQLPRQLRALQRARDDPTELRAPEVLRFRSAVVHLAADLIVGAVAGVLLWRNAAWVIEAAHVAGHYLRVDVLRREIEWLNDFPAGFKLNVPLTSFLGRVTLLVMDAYAAAAAALAPCQPLVARGVAAAAACGGVTAAVAAAYDLVSLLTLHVTAVQGAFAALLHLHSGLLGSLWKLFRGKKWNVLRRRVDSCEYGAQQLMLGTLLFTLLFFLFPTVAVYHAFFGMVRAAVVVAQAALAALYVLLNELPLCPLYLVATHPERLPGGFQLRVLATPQYRLVADGRISPGGGGGVSGAGGAGRGGVGGGWGGDGGGDGGSDSRALGALGSGALVRTGSSGALPPGTLGSGRAADSNGAKSEGEDDDLADGSNVGSVNGEKYAGSEAGRAPRPSGANSPPWLSLSPVARRARNVFFGPVLDAGDIAVAHSFAAAASPPPLRDGNPPWKPLDSAAWPRSGGASLGNGYAQRRPHIGWSGGGTGGGGSMDGEHGCGSGYGVAGGGTGFGGGGGGSPAHIMYMTLRRCDVPVASLFRGYLTVLRQLAGSYPAARIAGAWLLGQPLPPPDLALMTSRPVRREPRPPGPADFAQDVQSLLVRDGRRTAMASRTGATVEPSGVR